METEKKTVLVVEDERPLQEAIVAKLQSSGFEVKKARTASEGLAILASTPVQVIWLDHYLLGSEDGLDFVIKVKNHPEWQKTPIFLVSNTASPNKVQSYLQLGVNKYYTKSDFKLEEIIADINATLEKKE